VHPAINLGVYLLHQILAMVQSHESSGRNYPRAAVCRSKSAPLFVIAQYPPFYDTSLSLNAGD
jgi:hypothetical protein